MRKGEIRSADEIQLSDLDEIKSVLLPHSGFHRVSDFIHGSGFLPFVRTDLIEKSDLLSQVAFFMERVTRLELATSTLARWRSTG